MSGQDDTPADGPPLFAAVGDNTIDEYVGAESRSYVGGNALNVAVQLRRLGHACRYSGAIGADTAGARVRTALEAQGVRTDGLVTLPGHTSVSRIRVDATGDRTFEFEDFAVTADYVPDERELAALARCAVVHIGMLPAAGEVRRRLYGSGPIVSQDCAVSPGFDHLDVAFCSAGEDEGRARAYAEEAVRGGARLAVVTCGAAGSLAYDGRDWWRTPAEPVTVVDTTGAGDSYIAGFLAARATGADVAQAMRAGARTAARTCAHVGAWPQDAAPVG
ncbi:PfkB family carbohydrate kinase [Actinoallomurus soli]|uniref:PfkB family carbohydrate kinase n=1 Tax=Actinoallomurus soli TaxID=2952535 RepID=UPI002092FCC3|nr:PfkB family carbohydrate kinase [Actinoallomurus soli]MCO5970257.1 PfkB family carbohydrate kinase [Actinoallomurus soli]